MPRKKSKLIDTNIIIRFLTKDEPKLTKKAEELFKKAGVKELEIPDFILTEIVWVLLSFYKLDKKDVIEKLEGILAFEKFKLNRKELRRAIDIYRENNISFVDSYLIADGRAEDKEIVSFNKGVQKIAKK